jgi:hypothetical protein
LGATLYHLISDEAPVNGQARLGALAEDRPDPYVPLTGRFKDFPKGFLEAIDRALCTLPKQRLQSAGEWLAMYEGNGPEVVTLVEPSPGTDDAVQRLVTDFQREEARIEAITSAAMPAPAVIAKAASRPAAIAAATVQRGKGPAQLLAGVAVALVVVAGGYMMLGKPPAALDAAPEASPAVDVAGVIPTVDLVPVTETASESTAAAPAPASETPVETAAEPVAPDPEPAAVTVVAEPAAETPETDPCPGCRTRCARNRGNRGRRGGARDRDRTGAGTGSARGPGGHPCGKPDRLCGLGRRTALHRR